MTISKKLTEDDRNEDEYDIEMVEKLGNPTMAKLLETHLETFLDLYKKD